MSQHSALNFVLYPGPETPDPHQNNPQAFASSVDCIIRYNDILRQTPVRNIKTGPLRLLPLFHKPNAEHDPREIQLRLLKQCAQILFRSQKAHFCVPPYVRASRESRLVSAFLYGPLHGEAGETVRMHIKTIKRLLQLLTRPIPYQLPRRCQVCA